MLADDSGLEVLALGGAPGVYSSRYGGVEGDDKRNNSKLLKELEGFPKDQRQARFVCCLCLLDADGKEIYFEGYCLGRLVSKKEALMVWLRSPFHPRRRFKISGRVPCRGKE